MASATSATSRGHASSPHHAAERRNALSDRWCSHETVVRQQEEKMLKPHTRLLAILCCVALVGYAGMASPAEPQLVTESYMIPSRDPGIHGVCVAAERKTGKLDSDVADRRFWRPRARVAECSFLNNERL